MIRDAITNTSFKNGLTVATRTATANGAAIDMQNGEAAACLFVIGQSGDTLSGTVYLTCKLQESDDNTNWSDVAATDVIGPAANGIVIDAAAEDETVLAIGYRGQKRYVRGSIVFTGTHTNGTPVGIVNFLVPRTVPTPAGLATDVV